MSGIVVCYRKCWACMFDQHDSEWHTWADGEDIEGAKVSGQPDPSDQKCGCYCCAGAEAEAAATVAESGQEARDA